MHREEDTKAFKASVFTPESEPFDKARKDKKKKQDKDKRDSTTPATTVNAAEVGDKKEGKRRKGLQVKSRITSIINWDTTQTIVQSPGGQKTSIGLGDLHINDWS